MVSWGAKTPKGIFYIGICGVVSEIDTRWRDEYTYRIVNLHDEYPNPALPEDIWITESDLVFDECALLDLEEEEEEIEEEPIEEPKKGRWRPRKSS